MGGEVYKDKGRLMIFMYFTTLLENISHALLGMPRFWDWERGRQGWRDSNMGKVWGTASSPCPSLVSLIAWIPWNNFDLGKIFLL